MHLRPRHILQIFEKRARIWPIIGLLGVRQVGKSTFLRRCWASTISAQYLTLDRLETLDRISTDPENFLLAQSDNIATKLIIDETQKAPRLFDVLKLLADEHGKRGAFTLSGSVDFSLHGGIGEALTGRIGLSRLYPFTLDELHGRKFRFKWDKPLAKAQWSAPREAELWLERGGMPIFCGLADADERGAAIEEWLHSICHRDLLQLKGARYDGLLARRLLAALAKDPERSRAQLARDLDADARTIEKHLKGLEALFIVTRLDPHPKGTGQSRFLLFDAGVAAYLGAPLGSRLNIMVLNAVLAQHEYCGHPRPNLYYYRSRHGSEVDLVLENKIERRAICISSSASPRAFDVRALESFSKLSGIESLEILGPVTEPFQISKRVQVFPLVSRV